MRAGWVLLGLLTLSTGALANERYQALPLAGARSEEHTSETPVTL